jgi:hypothetical protein
MPQTRALELARGEVRRLLKHGLPSTNRKRRCAPAGQWRVSIAFELGAYGIEAMAADSAPLPRGAPRCSMRSNALCDVRQNAGTHRSGHFLVAALTDDR